MLFLNSLHPICLWKCETFCAFHNTPNHSMLSNLPFEILYKVCSFIEMQDLKTLLLSDRTITDFQGLLIATYNPKKDEYHLINRLLNRITTGEDYAHVLYSLVRRNDRIDHDRVFEMMYTHAHVSHLFPSIQLLLDMGCCDPTKDSNASLLYGCTQNIPELVSLLVRDPRVNPGAHENEALRVSAELGHWNVLDILISCGHPEIDPGVHDNHVFKQAARHGNHELVSRLLRHPLVDPTAETQFALRVSSDLGYTFVVRVLLSDSRVDASVQDDYALCIASKHGSEEIVRMLLMDERVDPCADHCFSLREAARYGRKGVLRLLLGDRRVPLAVVAKYRQYLE